MAGFAQLTLPELGSIDSAPALFLLGSLLGGVVGASIKFGFEDLLRPLVGTRREVRKVSRRYTVPLLRSAEALERRINILVKSEANRWFETDEYFRLSTLYVFGEYLGWIRVLEQSFGFLPFESSRKGKRFNDRLHGFFLALSSHTYFQKEASEEIVGNSSVARLKLTAIGEMMLTPDQGKVVKYTDFVQRYRRDIEYRAWFADLEAFLKAATPKDPLRWDRLILMGANLRGLICFLDPRGTMVKRRRAYNLELLHNPQLIDSLREEFPKLIPPPQELKARKKLKEEGGAQPNPLLEEQLEQA